MMERYIPQHFGSPFGSGGGREHLIIGAGAGVRVVLGVGDAPGVVGHEEEGVEDGAEGVVGEL